MRSYGVKFLVAALLALITAPALCAETAKGKVAIAPPPSWVQPVEIPRPAQLPVEQLSDGTYFLLVDRQARVAERRQERYSRYARTITNEQGVESSGQISVVFDPAYQGLTFHAIRILRGDKVIDQLKRENITVLQRESELESQIYDGALTANVVLKDLRVGDTVEYSYTLSGANPIFGGRFASGFELQWRAPVERVRCRLLWPAGRKLTVAQHRGEFPPQITHAGREDEYLWNLEHVPTLVPDDKIPEWYDPFPWVQLTEWSDWGQVAQWALALYPEPAAPSLELQEVMADIRKQPDAATRAVAALRFVQDQIRYMGFEAGEGSHAPRDPSLVLAQRFGDCKDKARLLITLLHAAGIEAAPALVNASNRRATADLAPTPLAFNHVIVRAVIDGRPYWFDPTVLFQRGDLAHLAQPDFGVALVLQPGTEGLTEFARQESAEPMKEIAEVYDLRGGMRSPATYTITTTWRGAAADHMRAKLAGTSQEELGRQYLKYYASIFPGVTARAAPKPEDNEATDTLKLTEVYTIPDLSKKNGEDYVVRFDPGEFSDAIVAPPAARRTMPLTGEMPRHLSQTSQVLLPEPWEIKADSAQVNSDYFDFHRDVAYAGNELTLRYEMVRKADVIAPEKAEDYAAQLKRVDNELGYRLSWKDAPPPTANWFHIGIAVGATLLGLFFAWRIWRWDPEPPQVTADPKLTGLRGWLAFMGFSLVVAAIARPVQLASLADTYFIGDSTLPNVSSQAQTAFHWLIAAEIGGNALLLIGSLLALLLYFRKRYVFRPFMKWYYLGCIVFLSADAGVLALLSSDQTVQKEVTQMVNGIIGTAAWLWYLQVSKRVASTFVGRRLAD